MVVKRRKQSSSISIAVMMICAAITLTVPRAVAEAKAEAVNPLTWRWDYMGLFFGDMDKDIPEHWEDPGGLAMTTNGTLFMGDNKHLRGMHPQNISDNVVGASFPTPNERQCTIMALSEDESTLFAYCHNFFYRIHSLNFANVSEAQWIVLAAAGTRVVDGIVGADLDPPLVHKMGGIDVASETQVIFTNANCVREYRIDANILRTLAGKCGTGGNVDGQGQEARFGYLEDVAVDKLLGVAYIAHARFTLRKLDLRSLVVSTVGAFGNKDDDAHFVNLAMFSETSTLFVSDRGREGVYVWTKGAGAMIVDRNSDRSNNGLMADPKVSARIYNMVVKNPIKNEVYFSDKYAIRFVNGSYFNRTYNIDDITVYLANSDERPLLFSARYRFSYQHLRHIEFAPNGDIFLVMAHFIVRIPYLDGGHNGVPETMAADKQVTDYVEKPLPDDKDVGVVYVCSVNKLTKYNFTDYALYQNQSTAMATLDEGLTDSAHGVIWRRFLLYIHLLEGKRRLKYISLDDLPPEKVAEGYNKTGDAGVLSPTALNGAAANDHVERIYFVDTNDFIAYVDLSPFLKNFTLGEYVRVDYMQTTYDTKSDRNGMLLLDENTLFITDIYHTYVWDPTAPYPEVDTKRVVTGTTDSDHVANIKDGVNSPFAFRYHCSSLSYSVKENEIVCALHNQNKVMLLGTAIRSQLKHVRDGREPETLEPSPSSSSPPAPTDQDGSPVPTPPPPPTAPDGSPLPPPPPTTLSNPSTNEVPTTNPSPPSTSTPSDTSPAVSGAPPATADPEGWEKMQQLRFNSTACAALPLEYRVVGALFGKTEAAQEALASGEKQSPWLVAAFPPLLVQFGNNTTDNNATTTPTTSQVQLTMNEAKDYALRLILELTSCHRFAATSSTQRIGSPISVIFDDGAGENSKMKSSSSFLEQLEAAYPGSVINIHIMDSRRQAVVDLNFSPPTTSASAPQQLSAQSPSATGGDSVVTLPFHLPLYVPVNSDKEHLSIRFNLEHLVPPPLPNISGDHGRRRTASTTLNIQVDLTKDDDGNGNVDPTGSIADGLIQFQLALCFVLALGGTLLARVALCGVAARQFALTVITTLTLSRHLSSSSLTSSLAIYTPGLTTSLPFFWSPTGLSLFADDGAEDADDTATTTAISVKKYFGSHAGALVGNVIVIVAFSMCFLLVWGLVIRFYLSGVASVKNDGKKHDRSRRRMTSLAEAIFHHSRPARLVSFAAFLWVGPTLTSALTLILHSDSGTHVVLAVVVLVVSIAFVGLAFYFTRRSVAIHCIMEEKSLSSTSPADVVSLVATEEKSSPVTVCGVWMPKHHAKNRTINMQFICLFGPLFEDFKPPCRDLFPVDLILMFFAAFIMAIIPANADHVLYKGGFYFILLAVYAVVFYVTCPELKPLPLRKFLRSSFSPAETHGDTTATSVSSSTSSSSVSSFASFSKWLDNHFGNKTNVFHMTIIVWQLAATFLFLMIQSSSDGGNSGTTTLRRDRLMCAVLLLPSAMCSVCLLFFCAKQSVDSLKSQADLIFRTSSSSSTTEPQTATKEQTTRPSFRSTCAEIGKQDPAAVLSSPPLFIPPNVSPAMCLVSLLVSLRKSQSARDVACGLASVHPECDTTVVTAANKK